LDQKDVAAGGFWVDDFVGVGTREELDVLAKGVDAKYGITGLEEVRWVLGMLIERDRAARPISISQEAFINSILARFNLADATPLTAPVVPGTQLSGADFPTSQDDKDEMGTRPHRELVGALVWLALGTCPGIAFATSRIGHSLGRIHREAARRVFRYLKGTKGIVALGEPDHSLTPLVCIAVLSFTNQCDFSDTSPLHLDSRVILFCPQSRNKNHCRFALLMALVLNLLSFFHFFLVFLWQMDFWRIIIIIYRCRRSHLLETSLCSISRRILLESP
jgi:hypothetical protein